MENGPHCQFCVLSQKVSSTMGLLLSLIFMRLYSATRNPKKGLAKEVGPEGVKICPILL